MLALRFEMTNESGEQQAHVASVESGSLYLVPPGTQRVVLRFGEAGKWRVAPFARQGAEWWWVGEAVAVTGEVGEDVALQGNLAGVDALLLVAVLERSS